MHLYAGPSPEFITDSSHHRIAASRSRLRSHPARAAIRFARSCIYTAQGFEFNYVGVIWGEGLRYDPDAGKWLAISARSLVKNTYRMLLTRGLKGCYVCCVHKNTEHFVCSRTEPPDAAPLAPPAPSLKPEPVELPVGERKVLPFRRLPPIRATALLELHSARRPEDRSTHLYSHADDRPGRDCWVELP
jgi:hypothetical protein